MSIARILIADDDPSICDILQAIVADLGHEVACVSTSREAIEAASTGNYDVILLDLNFPDCSDLSTLTSIRQKAPHTDVIMVTAQNDDIGVVAQATRLGAFDYVPKPVRTDDIRIRLTRAMEMRELAHFRNRAVAELAKGKEFSDIVGNSVAMQAVVKQAREMAASDIPVIIIGETGTGKELVARALHYGGPRRDKPFVSINCAALPHELTESELFGHEKGAFTGAHAHSKGAFQEAEDGTLFLDEIGDMNLQSQAALLQVLERGEYRSIGGKVKKNLARLIFASNQDLEKLISEGAFRKDLFYRVNRIRIEVPPLRNRRDDVTVLTQFFIDTIDDKIGKGIRNVASEAMQALRQYAWPGNVRELKNEIERAYVHADTDTIMLLDLSPEVLTNRLPGSGEPELDPASLDELMRLAQALRTTSGNIAKAAELLGVHRNTVRRWMRRYSLERN